MHSRCVGSPAYWYAHYLPDPGIRFTMFTARARRPLFAATRSVCALRL